MSLTLTFLFILCLIGLYYVFVRRRNYWKKRGVIEVKMSLLQTIYEMLLNKRSLHDIYTDEVYKKYSNEPFVGTYLLGCPILYINEPELMGQIYVKDFNHFHDRQEEMNGESLGHLIHNVVNLSGDKWKSVRNKLLPTFSAAKLKRMYGLLEECARLLENTHLRVASETKNSIEMKDLMSKYSLDCIGSCAFGLNFNTIKEPNSQYREISKLMFAQTPINLLRLMLQTLSPKMLKWLRMKAWPEEVETFFFNLLKDAENQRKNESEHRCDFLQSMLDIRDLDEEQGKTDSLFTSEHVASNMFVFYGAGVETTSNTLAFCFYELALNVEIQHKLRDEINNVRKRRNGILDYDAIKDMSYLDMVVSETLRKHTPSGHNARLCTGRYQLPGTSLILEPGELVLIPVSPIQFDEKYFPQPNKFDPERFNEENTRARTPFTYLPFGDGPRMCLGLRFAKLEIKCCLTSILPNYHFSPCSKTEVPVTLSTKSIFRTPKNGIWLNVEKI